MARRSDRTRAGHAKPRRLARARLGPSASDLVIISRALTDLAEFLQRRQESVGRGRVIVDRREGERRRAPRVVDQDRRQSDRRHPSPEACAALMRVLGFMVIPTAGSTNGGRPSGTSRPARAPGGAARSGRPAPAHRARRGRP
jgi:hypothetical protein